MTTDRRRQWGFSLVELMVALALGLAVSALVARIWANNRASFRSQDNNARLLENGRFALQLLERELRLAGYKGLNQESAPSSQLFGNGMQVALTGSNDNQSSVNSVTSDTLAVAFYGSGTGASGDGTVTNCFGTAIPGATQVQDQFWVQVDTATSLPALYCQSTLTTATTASVTSGPAVYSVETLQVQYGEETDGLGSGTPNRYVHAGSVTSFDNVTEIRLSLLVRGEDRTALIVQQSPSALKAVAGTGSLGVKYYHFGTSSTSPYTAVDSSDTGAVTDLSTVRDGRQRTLYGTTVALRNRTN
jgi:type IV pilus assembly protein PilW